MNILSVISNPYQLIISDFVRISNTITCRVYEKKCISGLKLRAHLRTFLRTAQSCARVRTSDFKSSASLRCARGFCSLFSDFVAYN